MTTTDLVPYPGPVALQGNRGTLARVGKGHDGQGDAERLTLRLEAISELLLLGYTYRQIGATVGISKTHVGREVAKIRELRAQRTATNEQTRIEEEDAKLDYLERIALRAAAEDPKHIGTVLACMARRASLHGFDKPSKIEHSGTLEHNVHQERVNDLLNELERKRQQKAG